MTTGRDPVLFCPPHALRPYDIERKKGKVSGYYQIDDPPELVIKSDIDDVTRLDHGPNVMMVTG